MNKNILSQLKQIRLMDNEELMARQLYWANLHKARNTFLQELNNKLTDEGFVRGTKQRSKKYSDEVVKYDKEHRQLGWK